MIKRIRARKPFVLLLIWASLLVGAFTLYQSLLNQKEKDLISVYRKINMPSDLGYPEILCPKRIYLSEMAECTFTYKVDMKRFNAVKSIADALRTTSHLNFTSNFDNQHDYYRILYATSLGTSDANYTYTFTFNPVEDDIKKPPIENISDVTVRVTERKNNG